MTPQRKYIITQLLLGGYLVGYKRLTNVMGYRLCDAKGNPLKNIYEKSVRSISKRIDPSIKLWKKDKDGRMRLNLSSVRSLHGKNGIKKLYKQINSSK